MNIKLKSNAPAAWLAALTGAPWEASPEGPVLKPWEGDLPDPQHLGARLEARLQQARYCVAHAALPPLDESRVRLLPVALPGPGELPVLQQGFELAVVDDLATMADLAEAISRFAEAQPWSRTRPPEATETCEGCPHCCEQPVPISSLDLVVLGEAPNLGWPEAAEDLAGCMLPLADGFCEFLDRETLRCTVHARRPWVCRSFFCCPEGPVAEAVREELLGHILASTLDLGVATPLRSATDYRQVLLIDLLSPAVWRAARSG